VVSFRGVVNYDVEFQPYAVSTRQFARTMRDLAADTSIKSIVIVFDSPGGMVTGTPEAADAVFAAREGKKISAVVDTMAASAAYWVASQCSEITCLPSGFGVGSIGVRMAHVECSAMLQNEGIIFTHIFSGEYKTEGNMTEPLTEAARDRYQMECDLIYADFVAAVARGRQVTKAEVMDKFGKGRLLMPAEAKKLGLLDRLELLDDSYRRLGVISTPSDTSARAEEQASVEPAAALEFNREGFLGNTEPPTPAEPDAAPPEDRSAAGKIDLMKRALDLAALD
jgi:signal peptide peptidase SppA